MFSHVSHVFFMSAIQDVFLFPCFFPSSQIGQVAAPSKATSYHPESFDMVRNLGQAGGGWSWHSNDIGDIMPYTWDNGVKYGLYMVNRPQEWLIYRVMSMKLEFEDMGVSIVMGVPEARWMVYFMETQSINGWFRSTPILGNLQMVYDSPASISKISLNW